MVLGCLLLLLILNRYEWKTKVSSLTPAPAATFALNNPPAKILEISPTVRL